VLRYGHTRHRPKSGIRRIALAALGGAQFIVILDSTIVNVALPSISDQLDLSQSNVSWVFNAYTLLFAGCLLLGGRLTDHFGSRRLFLGGISLFTLASLSAAVAPNAVALIAARGLQGLGAAMVFPSSLSLLSNLYPDGMARNRAIAIATATSMGGIPAGLILGGVLVEYVGWSAIFLINIPLGLALLGMSHRAIPRGRSLNQREYDVLGAVLATVGLSLVTWTFIHASEHGWTSRPTLALGGTSAITLACFAWREWRGTAHPLVPTRIFTNQRLRRAVLIGITGGIQIYAPTYYVSFHLQEVLGYGALQAGLAFLPYGLMLIVADHMASFALTRFGFKVVMVIGLILVALGLFILANANVSDGYEPVLISFLLLGAGLGPFFVAVNVMALSEVSPSDTGVAAGVVTTATQVGGALGLAALVTAYNVGTGNSRVALASSVFDGVRTAYAVAVIFAFLALVLAVTTVSGEDSRAHARRARAG
jgi:EmrB/QacA subfamily drug resistance transporter